MKKMMLVSANNCRVPYPVFPIGLAYLSGRLKKEFPDAEVSMFDLLINDLNGLSRFIAENEPEYIGISLRNIDNVDMSHSISFMGYYKEVVSLIRSVTSAKLIIGGSGFSVYPSKVYEILGADFGIYGDGEDTLVRLIKAIDSKDDYSDIPGLIYKKDKKTVINPKILSSEKMSADLYYDTTMLDYYWKQGGILNIQTKKGCPNKCIYCTYPVIEGNRIRKYDVKSIVHYIDKLYKEYGIDFFFITDSIFNIDDDYAYEFASSIIALDIPVRWAAYFSPHGLKKELLSLLKKSGLTHIEFGTDSLSNTQLIKYKKDFTVSDVMESSDLCRGLDINFAHFMILGGYGETDETARESLKNSELIDKTVYFPFIGMRIYPGTELFDIAKNEGKITDGEDLIIPKFYISDNFNIDEFRNKAAVCRQRWVFPDEDMSVIINKMREKNKKGPLWEYLIK